MDVRNFKCVVVGDGAVGKTCMLVCFAENTFPKEYVPTIFDNHTVRLLVDEKPINLEIYDTAGQEDFDKLRPLSYSDTDVFIICYAVSEPNSYHNIESKWVPELGTQAPGCPYVLVATKADLREGKDADGVSLMTRAQGDTLAKNINAYAFIECSALKQSNLKEVFDEACRCVFSSQTGETGGNLQDGEGNGADADATNGKKAGKCCFLF